MSANHQFGSVRQLCRHRTIHTAEVIEINGERGRRTAILSPKEQGNVVKRWLYFGQSITKLSGNFNATEQAIENVIRQRLYHIYPPTGKAA